MPPETIRALAAEIANQTILSNWLFYIVLGALTVVLSAAGAFLSTYFGKRAERLALTADFEEMKRQLRETASISESIKADIQRLSERSEKLQWLKREKLEQYVVAVLRGVEFLSKDMQHRFFDVEAPSHEDPLLTASMFQKLYLPELDKPHAVLLQTVVGFRQWVAQGMQQRLDAAKTSGAKSSPDQAHLNLYPKHLELLNAGAMVVEQAAKELARELNKV
jgi:hypothetical protein